ncbi:hypothetical protein HR12_45845, partial [Microbacterium sp. SUBG005]
MTLYVLRRFLNYAILSLLATCLAYVLGSALLRPQDLLRHEPASAGGLDHREPERAGRNPDVPILVRLWNWLVNLFTRFSLGSTIGGQDVVVPMAQESRPAPARA